MSSPLTEAGKKLEQSQSQTLSVAGGPDTIQRDRRLFVEGKGPSA